MEASRPSIDPLTEKTRQGIVEEWTRSGRDRFVQALDLIIEKDRDQASLGQMARDLHEVGLIEEGVVGIRQFTHLLSGYDGHKDTLKDLLGYLKTPEGEQHAS